jgi:hypothetical protein
MAYPFGDPANYPQEAYFERVFETSNDDQSVPKQPRIYDREKESTGEKFAEIVWGLIEENN